MKRKKAIVAGHICIDITPVFPEKTALEIGKIFSPGKLIQMNGVDIHTGGCVANTGLAMKILGADVSLMGKIGDDELGALIQNILRRYHAADGMIVDKDVSTSYSVVLAVPGIDRIFLHASGANDTFSYEDLDFEQIGQATLFHFGYPTIMKRMYEKDGEELVRILKQVKACGVAVSLDMSAIDASSEAAKADWKKILAGVLPYVDFFLPSAEELCFMLDRERYRQWEERAEGGDMAEILSMEDVKPLADEAVKMGARVVLIKCGAPGMYYKTVEEESILQLCNKLGLDSAVWAGQEGFAKSYKPEVVLSGTGAGDTSIAAFLCAVLKEYSLEEALQMATATGASCVAAYDALSGLKSFEELRAKIAAGWQFSDEELNKN